MTTYAVQPGNTLSAIAKKFGVTVPAIMTENNIADPNKLSVGQTLIIPEFTTDQASLPPIFTPTPTPPGAIAINRTDFALGVGQYFAEVFPKDLVVLHFTAGRTARSAFDSWRNTPSKVATAYIVDIDGTIYECFDPKYWAYHLGITGADSANWKHDKRSIAIEIANVGPLKQDPANANQLNWWPPSDNKFETKWCTKAEVAKYVAAPYRTFQFFASFPAVQITAVSQLVADVCARFAIPKVLAPAVQRDVFAMPFFKTFSGIATHQNFRIDKTDVGPAFPWASL